MVKFDLYNNTTGAGGPGANFTGLYCCGVYPQPDATPPQPYYDMAPSGINMESGDLMRATLAYNGTVLTETVTDTVTEATYTNTYTVNIPSLVAGNTGYVGFGGGTGAATVTTNIDSWTYTVQSPGQASAPTFSPAAGTYSGSQNVTLSSASSGAIICYNTTGGPATNGSSSCATGTLYTGPVTVSSSETLYAVAGGTGYDDSPIVSASYVMQPWVSTPTFSPVSGTYTSAQSVTISDATANATIYFTTDGSAPTTSSAKYAGPITVSSTETLKAIAVATGATNSAVASAAYNITPLPVVATPTFSPTAETYTSAQSVTISDATSGATIYYTTNGTTPTTSSTAYTGAITVSSTETLQAIAVAPGATNSAVASAAYTINSSQPSFMLGASPSALTVSSGGQGTVTLTVTPENGFHSPVVLACSGLPSGATCSFAPGTVTPSGAAASTQLTISTSAQSSALHTGSRPFFPLTALAMTACLFGWRKRRGWLLVAVAYAGLGLLFGCGGTGGGGGTSATPTPSSPTAATSTVTLTAISGTLQGSATITLTVN